MPDGKLIQQPSTHMLGQHFSKAFNIKFKDKNGIEKFAWQTCYGPAISRILASVISTHGDNLGLVIPFCISPIQVVIIPIFNKNNKIKILKESEKIKNSLKKLGLDIELDSREERRPGEKFYEWELKGVPFRIEFGEKELKERKIVLFVRDTKKKERILISKIKDITKMGKEYDSRLLKNADRFLEGKIVKCKTKEELKKAMANKKIAKVNFCSVEKEGIKCANIVEKEIGATIRGTMANKDEKPDGNCIICGKKAHEVVYIGKSY